MDSKYFTINVIYLLLVENVCDISVPQVEALDAFLLLICTQNIQNH